MAVPSTVDEFLERLEKAGGELRIAAPSDEVRAAWRRIIHAVRQGRHVPEGWHLLHRGRNSGDLVIEMRRGEHPYIKYRRPVGDRVPVPDALVDPHPVVKALREEPARLPASPANRGRALLISQAVAEEAGRRGLAVAGGAGNVLLEVEALGFRYKLRVSEESGARWDLRLVVEVDGPEMSSVRWADRSGWLVEEALGQVLDEIVRCAAAARQDADEQDRKQAEREAAERAMKVHEHRARVLRAQVAAWRQAEQIREHCDQLVAAGMAAGDDWVIWARARAAEIDPLADPPGMPGPLPNRVSEPRLSPPARVSSWPEPKPWHPNQKWYSR